MVVGIPGSRVPGRPLLFRFEGKAQVALEQRGVVGQRQRRGPQHGRLDGATDGIVCVAAADLDGGHLPAGNLGHENLALEAGLGAGRPDPVALDLLPDHGHVVGEGAGVRGRQQPLLLLQLPIELPGRGLLRRLAAVPLRPSPGRPSASRPRPSPFCRPSPALLLRGLLGLLLFPLVPASALRLRPPPWPSPASLLGLALGYRRVWLRLWAAGVRPSARASVRASVQASVRASVRPGLGAGSARGWAPAPSGPPVGRDSTTVALMASWVGRRRRGAGRSRRSGRGARSRPWPARDHCSDRSAAAGPRAFSAAAATSAPRCRLLDPLQSSLTVPHVPVRQLRRRGAAGASVRKPTLAAPACCNRTMARTTAP